MVTPDSLRASAHGIAELTGALGIPAPPWFALTAEVTTYLLMSAE